jgi:ABC-type Fe3+/spermidine/putrescine transport system ATPase subunit
LHAEGVVESVLYLGANTRFDVRLNAGGHLAVVQQNREGQYAPTQGEAVTLHWDKRHLLSFAG